MSDHRFDPLDRLAELFPDPGFTIERLEKRRALVRRRRAVVGGATATFGLAGVAALLAATIGFGDPDVPRAVSSPVDSVAATAPSPDGFVTEEVEPGVERVISDDAGHDLDETHPTNRYDMDNVFVTPDGTVWLSTSYSGSDNDANPGGSLVWALGQPGTTRLPEFFCGTASSMTRDGETINMGVSCFNPASGEETTYLLDKPINQVAVAPDGTVWAVGGHDGEKPDGGLYHITPDWADAATTATT